MIRWNFRILQEVARSHWQIGYFRRDFHDFNQNCRKFQTLVIAGCRYLWKKFDQISVTTSFRFLRYLAKLGVCPRFSCFADPGEAGWPSELHPSSPGGRNSEMKRFLQSLMQISSEFRLYAGDLIRMTIFHPSDNRLAFAEIRGVASSFYRYHWVIWVQDIDVEAGTRERPELKIVHPRPSSRPFTFQISKFQTLDSKGSVFFF